MTGAVAPTPLELAARLGGEVIADNLVRVRMVVTPALATEWLKLNTANYRPMDDYVASCYGRQMAAGKWHKNNAAIAFHVDGHLADGQKRLRGCQVSNTPFETEVIWGVETAEGIDLAKRRSLDDVLRNMHVPYYAQLSTAARFLHAYNMQALDERVVFGNDEILETIQKHKRLGQFVAACYGRTACLSPSIVAAVTYVGCRRNVDHPKLARFLDGLETGTNLSNGSPILAARELFARVKFSNVKFSSRSSRAHIVLAWNAHAAGKKLPVKRLLWKESGPDRQSFPTIVLAPAV